MLKRRVWLNYVLSDKVCASLLISHRATLNSLIAHLGNPYGAFLFISPFSRSPHIVTRCLDVQVITKSDTKLLLAAKLVVQITQLKAAL